MIARRVALLVAVVGAVAALAPFVAGANHLDVEDPNDVDGRLDVKRVETGGTDRPRWKVVTYSTWQVKRIRDKGYFLVYLDTFGDEWFDYYALVRSDGRHLRASLWRDRRVKADKYVSELDEYRKGARSVVVRVPLAKVKLPDTRLFYRWYVQTLFIGKSCQNVCFDRAPDGEPMVEPNPAVTPTPTE